VASSVWIIWPLLRNGETLVSECAWMHSVVVVLLLFVSFVLGGYGNTVVLLFLSLVPGDQDSECKRLGGNGVGEEAVGKRI
jgi:hypothetical protein